MQKSIGLRERIKNAQSVEEARQLEADIFMVSPKAARRCHKELKTRLKALGKPEVGHD
jgi:hypothetical protein